MNGGINQEARFKLVQARVELLFSACFFGALAMRLLLVEDESCFTMYTDGKIIGYNPYWVLSLTPVQCQWSLVHEILHAANGHPWRRNAREFNHWAYSCDASINFICDETGFARPQGVVHEPTCQGKSAEWAYAHLPRQPQICFYSGQGSPQNGGSGGQGQSGGQGNQNPQAGKAGARAGSKKGSGKQQPGGQGHCGCDGVRDAGTGLGSSGGSAPTEADWQIAVTQAANAARAAGQLPASLEYLIGKLEAPRIDWRAALRRFVQDFASADYSWRQPNKKYVASRLFLPSLRSEQMPEIVICVDTSGSVSDQELTAFFSEIQSIVDEVKPLRTHIVQCDASVKVPHDTYEAGERFLDREIKVHGRGGTSFRPSLQYVKREQIDPACLVYLTDLYPNDGYPDEPPYPVIWVSTTDQKAPFGETVWLSDGGVR